ICIDLEIGADRVMCFDRLTGKSWKMVPVDVEQESFQLKNTGFQFIRLDGKMLEYRENADYVIGLLDLRDLQTLEKMAIDQNAKADAFKVAELFNREDVKVHAVTYITTQYYTKNFPDKQVGDFFDALQDKVPALNAISETQYFVEIEYEEEIVDLFMKIRLIHGEDLLYLLSCG
ncbi:MAG: hypothetical protein U0K53_05515, partial [Paludibacteraceae bacterium]|nr:hypothetical protein [Paludibacteraceae bacterium]